MPDTIWPTVVGGAISLASTAVTTFGLEHLRRTREARGAAYAFRGNIIGILTIIEIRQYIALVRAMIAHMEAGNAGSVIKVRVKQNYLEVYNRNVDKLGNLVVPLPELISIFYTNINSLIEDMQVAYDGERDGLASADLLRLYKEFEALLTQTSNLGHHIVDVVTKSYPPPRSFRSLIPG